MKKEVASEIAAFQQANIRTGRQKSKKQLFIHKNKIYGMNKYISKLDRNGNKRNNGISKGTKRNA